MAKPQNVVHENGEKKITGQQGPSGKNDESIRICEVSLFPVFSRPGVWLWLGLDETDEQVLFALQRRLPRRHPRPVQRRLRAGLRATRLIDRLCPDVKKYGTLPT